MMDPADIEPGDVLVDDEGGALLLAIAVGKPQDYSSGPDALGVMYTFLDELPLRVYGPWILYPGALIGWSKKREETLVT